jgi:uncharacterized protein YggE
MPIVLLLLLLAPLAAGAQQNTTPEPPVVVTSGEGTIQATPDRAWITISAESRAGNPRAAAIPSDAIRTLGYDLQQEWDYVNNLRVSRGYVARNTIDVRVDAIAAGQMEIRVQVTVTSLLK